MTLIPTKTFHLVCEATLEYTVTNTGTKDRHDKTRQDKTTPFFEHLVDMRLFETCRNQTATKLCCLMADLLRMRSD